MSSNIDLSGLAEYKSRTREIQESPYNNRIKRLAYRNQLVDMDTKYTKDQKNQITLINALKFLPK